MFPVKYNEKIFCFQRCISHGGYIQIGICLYDRGVYMKLYLVKPDLVYYEKYNDMMSEWCASKTQIAPWFLDSTIMSIDEFAQFIF